MYKATRKFATPGEVRQVYSAAQLMGHPMPGYKLACAIAAKFTPSELDRLVKLASRRRNFKGRLTLVR